MGKAGGEETHFGFERVAVGEKRARVGGVFDAVAGKYDLMNDLMSGGAHRGWKRFAAMQSGLRRGDAVVDVAAGSGDMARLFAAQVGAEGRVVLSDVNAAMLAEGKRRMVDAGWVGNVGYARADAEALCFAEGRFHCACIAFGLRNVTRPGRALAAMHQVLRAGGRLLVLEFSKPVIPWLERVYDWYSFEVIPELGRRVAGDAGSYRYLVESIRRHPPQGELKAMMEGAGFDEVRVHNLSGGIVALHVGYKY